MDLSNRQEAEYWHRRAEEVTDPDLRREALAAHRKFVTLAEREEKARLRYSKPGYGVRSLIGWFIFASLIVLVVILGLSKFFSIYAVCGAFSVVIALPIIAAGIAMRVHGHISEDTMLAMIQNGLKRLDSSGASTAQLNANKDEGPTSTQHQLPQNAPTVSFDTDKK